MDLIFAKNAVLYSMCRLRARKTKLYLKIDQSIKTGKMKTNEKAPVPVQQKQKRLF
jgi:hypothetical protein